MDFGNANSKEMKVFVWITMKLAMKYTDKFSPCVTEGLLWNFHRLMFSKYYEKILQSHIRQRFREASNKLTTALINLKRKFSSRIVKDPQSRRKKKWGEKGENIKGEAFTTEGMLASRKTNFKELAGEVFYGLNKIKKH